ncbi:TetR/AcrR family transcriptional regulator [Thermosediminibacter litoriperuensis]|uniref:TetR family transcriptional regulator n=1 Tax=Thermosediminibacter litoriperuensis TaxID=291989 RepID=A0A5S5AXE2_9FIRM|nr:TetR/AcrR family transcriptional regulator [Thermosediminibacter litoriperuensis]TYP58530.1 TetR family transcriptional regulator [Thermosediminibacter litoriperuensis]
MPAAFSEREKALIKSRLLAAAEECLQKFGVKKTSVEQLTKMAGISKGAFYIFYGSKEMLFFEVVEKIQHAILSQLMENLSKKDSDPKTKFIDAIFEAFVLVKNSSLINLIQGNEIEIILRKLPDEVIKKHHSFDSIFIKNLLKVLEIEESGDINTISAALRAVFITTLYEKQIGEYYHEAIKLLVTGLAEQIFKGNDNWNGGLKNESNRGA